MSKEIAFGWTSGRISVPTHAIEFPKELLVRIDGVVLHGREQPRVVLRRRRADAHRLAVREQRARHLARAAIAVQRQAKNQALLLRELPPRKARMAGPLPDGAEFLGGFLLLLPLFQGGGPPQSRRSPGAPSRREHHQTS